MDTGLSFPPPAAGSKDAVQTWRRVDAVKRERCVADWLQIGRPSQVVICHMRLQEVSIQTSPRLAPSEMPSRIRGSFIVCRPDPWKPPHELAGWLEIH